MPTFGYQVLPPLEDFKAKEIKPVKKLMAEYTEKQQQFYELKRRHEEARNSLNEAQERDQRERAAALRASKEDPGKRHEEKVRAELATIEDRSNVLEVVMEDVERDLTQAIIEAKGALIKEARAKREEAAKAYTEASRRLREAHDTFKLYDGLVRWAFSPGAYFSAQPADPHVLSVPAVLEDNDPEKPSAADETISTQTARGILRGA